MSKQFLGIFSLAVVSFLALGLPAKADQITDDTISDPFINEAQPYNTCPSNCGSVVLAVDPISGIKTVEYIFNSTVPTVLAGDLLLKEQETNKIGDVLRFEDINGVSVAFLFSDDPGNGHPYPADVGLPPSYQSNTVTLTETSIETSGSTYTPSSGQPGFCQITKVINNVPTLVPCAGYVIQSDDAIPEPGTLALFGAGLIGLGALRRRKVRKAA